MNLAEPMVLPSDVRILPVTDLPVQVRRRLKVASTDFALARANSRTPDKVVAAASAELLQQFYQPRRIVDAVIAFSRVRELDPAEVLNGSFPLLRDLVNERLLVPSGSPDALTITPMLKPGQRVGGTTVIRPVQILSDTELYQARQTNGSWIALKIARRGQVPKAGPILAREGQILARLEGTATPRLLATGSWRGLPYLMEEWKSGVSPESVAGELRSTSPGVHRSRLLGLAASIVEAYAALHAQGVIHADVHPGNLLIAGSGEVTILDFGLSHCPGIADGAARGGVGFFFDPEYARALHLGAESPAPTQAGEQYSVAALAYFLLSGHHHLAFSPHETEVWRQIGVEATVPFSRWGIRAWPEVESCLSRALSKTPERRFGSMAELAAALRQVKTTDRAPVPRRNALTERFLERVLIELGPNGRALNEGLAHAPTASVNLGAAGIAYGLYRIACLRDDARLLATADRWQVQAMSQLGRPVGWYAPDVGISRNVVGRVSPYHSATGVHCVGASLSQARGDRHGQALDIAEFVRLSSYRCRNPDLVLGRAGTLLACAQLSEAIRDPQIDATSLSLLGDQTMAALLDRLGRYPSIGRSRRFPNLGVAHGWAGVLYAIIRWCRAQDHPLPQAVPVRLAQLAAVAEGSGRGAVWRWVSSESFDGQGRYMPGWCNGSAGFVFLWTLAYRQLGDPAYLTLAERAAWDAWENPTVEWNLCCGLTGRAYALLNLFKHTGEDAWLERARTLATRAVGRVMNLSGEESRYRHSLFRGVVGVAALIADLECPDESCLPMFEEEGWRNG